MILGEQIALYIDSKGVGTFNKLGSSGNIYIDALAPKEDIIAIYHKGGGKADVKLGYQVANIQIIYRGNGNPITSKTKADLIYNAMKVMQDVTIEGGNYIVCCLSLQGQAECIGKNENGQYEYTMNFVIEFKSEEV